MENSLVNQDTKHDLINRLIDVNNQLEQLWVYHPLNPNKLDISRVYSVLRNELDKIKVEIEERF